MLKSSRRRWWSNLNGGVRLTTAWLMDDIIRMLPGSRYDKAQMKFWENDGSSDFSLTHRHPWADLYARRPRSSRFLICLWNQCSTSCLSSHTFYSHRQIQPHVFKPVLATESFWHQQASGHKKKEEEKVIKCLIESLNVSVPCSTLTTRSVQLLFY